MVKFTLAGLNMCKAHTHKDTTEIASGCVTSVDVPRMAKHQRIRERLNKRKL